MIEKVFIEPYLDVFLVKEEVSGKQVASCHDKEDAEYLLALINGTTEQKYMCIEILICYMSHRWDTDYVYIPFPEGNEVQEGTKERALRQWRAEQQDTVQTESITYFGIYNYNWDDQYTKDGDLIED